MSDQTETRITDSSPYAAFVRRIMRAYRRRIVAGGDPDDLVALVALAAEVEGALAESVARMRSDFGYSWADVGKALGVSRQAAQQRFGA